MRRREEGKLGISSAPHGYTLGDYRPDATQHIVARGPNSELFEWWWNREDGWRLVDLSARVGEQPIAGVPHGYTLRDYAIDATQHIAARGPNDELLEWWWNREDGWQLVDLSARVGGQKISSDPSAYILYTLLGTPTDTTQHIVARGPNDELLEWSWNREHGWRLFDLSVRVGGQLIAGAPQGYALRDTQHIVARGPNDELLEWSWNREHGWQLVDLSAWVGGQLIAGAPHGYTFGDSRHVVARGLNGELLEWYWNRQDGWRGVDLSALVGGPAIASDPHGYTSHHAVQLFSRHIVARGPNNELLEWWWNQQDGWHLVDLSARVGAGALISGAPHGYTFGDTQHVVARSLNDELLEWWWNEKVGWKFFNLG
jgi:hypothetical protein